MALPDEAVRQDHELEERTSRASEDLMRHRWHWTLDESNPDRVALKEYARAVGRAKSTIQADAHGWALMLKGGQDSSGPLTPQEARIRASMGSETELAAEAVASARGVKVTTARQKLFPEVRHVREIARERAEQRGTSVEEEAPRAADWLVKSDRARETQQRERAEKLGLRYVEMEGHLDKMRRAGVDALNLAHSVPWGGEERQLLEHTIANVKALINLIDVALSGVADVDWDKELAKITEG